MLMLQKPERYGRLIARTLPVGITADYEQTSKPYSRSIDPSTLVSGTGYNCFNPWESLSPSSPYSTPSKTSNLKSEESADHEDESQQQVITLDIYLFHKQNGDNQSPTHIRMNRIANEPVRKTLKRMEVSLSKKLKLISKSIHNDNKKSRQERSTATTSSSSLLRWSNGDTLDCSLDSSLPQNLLRHFEPWNVSSTLTDAQVWRQTIYSSLAVLIKIGDESIPLLVDQNPPSIVGVRTFESFRGHVFTQVPLVIEVDMMYGTHAVLDWYCDGELVCHDSPSFIPRDDHVGKYISVFITPTTQQGSGRIHDGSGCQEAYRFERPVEHIPDNVIYSLRPAWTVNRATGNSRQLIRALTYNILADQNAFSGDNETPFYPYVSADILRRSRRMPLILHEVLAYQADVICLQEVDEFVYESLFRPVLDRMGYQGFFSGKRSGGTKEGCAMFWSLTKFERASAKDMKTHLLRDLFPKPDDTTDLQDSSLAWKSLGDIQDLLLRRPDLKNIIDTKLGHVLQTACLQLKREHITSYTDDYNNSNNETRLPESLLVANTHLFYHPHADHIRMMQCFVILHQLDQERKRNCPILFCGDFNTSPTNCAVRLILDRVVPKNFNRLQQHLSTFHWGEGDQSNSEVPNTSQHSNLAKIDDNPNFFPAVELPNHFPTFASAFADEPPLFTHYIACYQGSLDHIMSSISSATNKHGLKAIARAPMPSASHVTRHVAMPSEYLPSDHVSLLCDLELTSFEE